MKSTLNETRRGSITIKAKLWLAVAITSAGMVFAAALGVLGMQAAVSTVRYLGDVKLQSVMLANQLQTSLIKQRLAKFQVMRYENVLGAEGNIEDILVDYNDAHADFKAAWEKYAKLSKVKAEADLWATLVEGSERWQQSNKVVAVLFEQLSVPHDEATHKKLMFAYGQRLGGESENFEKIMIDRAAGLLALIKDESVVATKAAISDANSSQMKITVISGGLIICSLIFGSLVVRSITRPLTRMIKTIEEIGEKDDFSRRVPLETNDEIGVTIDAFNVMIAKIEERSALLRQKTKDIQSMLQNIPQGILTIEGNQINPEYSDYLETILETKEVAGRDLMEVMFSNTNLGADTLSQVHAVIGACVGEDAMNFEFNSHLMIGAFEKRMPDGRIKILDLTWSQITDELGNTARLMLCLRDVTELRKLAAEASDQKRELEMVGEILAVTQEKFQEFVIGALGFAEENAAILRASDGPDPDVIAQMFRNMHTIKGNARTYGLKNLTNVVHEVEQSLEMLRKPQPDIAWDREQLLNELAGVRFAVERYAKINDVTLGRKGPGRRGNVDRYLMVDRASIDQAIQKLDSANASNLHDLAAASKAVHKALRLLGTEPISETLAGVLDSLPSLARELGKEVPTVKIEDHGFVILNQASGILKNVFMHLIRNSLDHGLESPQARLSQGKSAAGSMKLKLGVTDKMLQVELSDDGRGLSLARIRAIAIDKALISADETLSDDATAQLIFLPGFSTAEKVTEVSGRGVGMDAVRNFLKREGGKIEIKFIDQAEGADFRQFVTRVSLPENFTVNIHG